MPKTADCKTALRMQYGTVPSGNLQPPGGLLVFLDYFHHGRVMPLLLGQTTSVVMNLPFRPVILLPKIQYINALLILILFHTALLLAKDSSYDKLSMTMESKLMEFTMLPVTFKHMG